MEKSVSKPLDLRDMEAARVTGPRDTPLNLRAVEALTVNEIRRRLAVYAVSIDGFDSLNAGQQEWLTDCATWMHDKYGPLLAYVRALRAALQECSGVIKILGRHNESSAIDETLERAAAVLAQARDAP